MNRLSRFYRVYPVFGSRKPGKIVIILSGEQKAMTAQGWRSVKNRLKKSIVF